MAEYILQVPLVGQMSEQDVMPQKDAKGVRRWSGENACWYASACMVAYYYETGPRFGVPPIWLDNLGIQAIDLSLLARCEGLMAVPKPSWRLTSKQLIELLKLHGPIWAAGKYGNSGGQHAIVITGVRNQAVFYNDPWEPMAKQTTVQWIHANLLRSKYAMMVRAPVKTLPPPFIKVKSRLSSLN
jgi:hypothetical protein